MIIREIQLRDFMAHASTDVQLPDDGVVLITGPNGSGKSSVIEACAHALFGKSVRGDWGWQDPEDKPRGFISSVTVTTDRVTATRERGRGSPTLTWHKTGEAATDYDNTTKAQVALEAVVGTFDLWARAHVFSSGNAKRFALARDADRKRLLEAILGVDYFDPAAKIAKDKHNAAIATLDRIKNKLAQLDGKEQVAASQKGAALTTLEQTEPKFDPLPAPEPPVLPELGPYPAEPPPVEPLPEWSPDAPDPEIERLRDDLGRVAGHLLTVDEDLAEAREAKSAHNVTLAGARTKLREADDLLAKWPGGKCPTCRQDVPPDLLQPLIDESEALKAKAGQEADAAETALGYVVAQIEEIEEERRVLNERVTALRQRVTEHDAKRNAEANARADAERRHALAVSSREQAIVRARAAHEQSHRDRCASLQAQYDSAVETHRQRLADQQRQINEFKATRDKFTAEVQRLDDVLAEVDAERERVRGEALDAEAEVLKWEAVVSALGIKGVRAHVLGNALTGLEALANSWLRRIGVDGQQIQLREYTEKRNAALALEVRTAKRLAWHSYLAASQGEQRRIDVSLILALAEVSRAARGLARGTLFFDEVFDALDTEGISLVTDVLHELGQDRCAVVISHNEDLASMLEPVLHLRATQGALH